MDASEKPGLRERKKVRTREAMRREAFRLFEENGYPNTTVEQIAEAADVSPRTFFRYFPAKEYVLIDDDLIPPIIDAFVAAPADLPLIAAYKHAVLSTFAALTAEERDNAIRGQQLMYSIPEARGILYSHYVRLIGLIAEAAKARIPDTIGDFERRVLAGAIVGVLLSCADGTPMPGDPISAGLEILERRLNLDAPQDPGLS
ncbi:TetR family transcriptional regulator [[Mycobacterium] burgundiense]|uniref:TetR family transcriptional regulator n=1 Tax=[Mycobacterium] burgundiense TaxID=3064286 RepID=A0ABM9M3U9_9MYCO|nr:TetR family transcriptional regulator [Mycolicibacterium sp. MU0053]CAJ1509767.1 TetR family transcriptional regulator [Mycolicibacterium sp. MU0053]